MNEQTPRAATLSDLIKYDEIKQQLEAAQKDPEALENLIQQQSNAGGALVDKNGNPVSSSKTELQEDDEMYGIRPPRESCKHCYGRGIEGWRTSGKPILCRCLKRANGPRWITWKEFRALSNYFRTKDK